ncbi:MAG: hypothetical protein ACSLFK_07840, partial [Gemmatimonadaceae bacterium]
SRLGCRRLGGHDDGREHHDGQGPEFAILHLVGLKRSVRRGAFSIYTMEREIHTSFAPDGRCLGKFGPDR